MAANYLPAITAQIPSQQRAAQVRKAVALKDDELGIVSRMQMTAGKTYAFHLALVNPLYDPIQVRLAVQRQQVLSNAIEESNPDKPRRPSFAVSLPSSAFSIAAFAEAWEYEDDEEMFGMDDEDLLGRAGLSPVRDKGAKGKGKTVGVLEKKANTTVVGGEVVLGRDGRGDVKASSLLLNYGEDTYSRFSSIC